MKKKYWLLLLLLSLTIFGYIKLFYSSINISSMPANADMVATVDVKKVIRTVVWDIVTHTSKWKIKSSTNPDTDKVNLKDVFQLPDYGHVFHLQGEPLSKWYIVLKIDDEELFYKALKQYGFVKIKNETYTNDSLKLGLAKYEEKIIVSNYALDTINNLSAQYNNLFVKKEFIATEKVKQIVGTDSHINLFIQANNFLEKNATITANISNTSIDIKGNIQPKSDFSFSENNFSYSSNAIFSLGFTQPSKNIINAVSQNDRDILSRAIGVGIDTFLQQSNKNYNLQIDAIVPRADSAITFTYDDDFNSIQKVVVNNVEEPMYNFEIVGDSLQIIFSSLQKSNILIKDKNNYLYRQIPFVKSYCTVNNDKLKIAPLQYNAVATNQNIKAIIFANIMVSKIGKSYLKYLPDELMKSIERISSVNISCIKNNNQLVIKGNVDKANKGFLDFD